MQLAAEADTKIIESTAETESRAAGERATRTEPVIKLDHIHKIYKMGDIEVHALRGVSLAIRQGEFVAVMAFRVRGNRR